jgi:hypothetical protein
MVGGLNWNAISMFGKTHLSNWMTHDETLVIIKYNLGLIKRTGIIIAQNKM